MLISLDYDLYESTLMWKIAIFARDLFVNRDGISANDILHRGTHTEVLQLEPLLGNQRLSLTLAFFHLNGMDVESNQLPGRLVSCLGYNGPP